MPESADKRVLVVDDDPSTLLLTRRQLESSGYEVLTASNGAEAMRIVLTEGPKLVVSDWLMPEMNGMELCRAIREHEGAGFVYIIILTAVSDEDRLVEAFDAGADDFVVKPASKKELVARLRAGLRIVNLERDLAASTREVHLQNAQLAIVNDKLNTMAITDELTGLLNRRAALDRLREEWAANVRQGRPMSCISLDIDHFKSINDTHGHDTGDLVLREIAKTLRTATRLGEAVCRMGGEEFLVICPSATIEMACRAAERLRCAVEKRVISSRDLQLHVTISLGVAERTAAMEQVDDLLKAADDALYVAKRTGRNRVHEAGMPLPGATKTPKPAGDTNATRETAVQADEPTHLLVVTRGAVADVIGPVPLPEDQFETVHARDADEALRRLAKRPADVIFIAKTRSTSESAELIGKLRAHGRHRLVPTLAGCEGSADDAVALATALDADEYITLPARREELILRLRVLADLSRTRRALSDGNEFRGEQAVALGMLLEYSHNLATETEMDAILDRTVHTLGFLSRCRRVCILTPDENREKLRVARVIGYDGVESDTIESSHLEPLQRVLNTLQPLVLNESPGRLDPRFQGSPLLGTLPLVVAPLSTSGVTVGAAVLSGRIGREPFKPLDLEYIEFVTHIAASAVHGLVTRRARDEARDSIVIALGKLAEYRDNDTGEHVDHVTQYCLILADALRRRPEFSAVINESFIADLRKAAPLHDIGKVGIPDNILLKPGRLTPDEMAIMRQHCQIGADCIRSVMARTPGAGFLRMAVEIAWSHHEWWDGNGYPKGLAGEDIPLSARIAALADVYDALRMKRPYKDAMSHAQAREIIVANAGRQFDPRIVEAFIEREDEFASALARAGRPDHGRERPLPFRTRPEDVVAVAAGD